MYFLNISENVRKGLNLSLKNFLIWKLDKKKKLFRKAYIENLDFFNKEHLLRYFNFYSKFKYFFGILKTTFYEYGLLKF